MAETKEITGLSDEQRAEMEEKAKVLATQLSVPKVHPLAFYNPETKTFVECYLKEPNYMTKLVILDKVMSHGIHIASEDLRQACVLTDHSDPLTYSDAPQSDPFKLGVLDYIAKSMIDTYVDQFKKK
jgi:hypothetical protein